MFTQIRENQCFQQEGQLDGTGQGITVSSMDRGKQQFSGSHGPSKKESPRGLVIALAVAGGIVIGSAGTLLISKPLAAPKQSAAPAAPAAPAIVGMPQAQTFTMPTAQQFTPAPQPPGEVPPGKVWSVEHGHWHDAPIAMTTPASAPPTPPPATAPAPAATTPVPAPATVTPAVTTTPAPPAAPAEKKE